MKKGMKLFMMLLAMLTLGAIGAWASGTPTDFASAIPASLIPSGFWQLVGVVFTAVAAVWGVTKGIRLFKKA